MAFSTDTGTAFVAYALDNEANYPGWKFLQFFSVPSDKFWFSTLKKTKNISFHIFPTILHFYTT